MLCIKAYMINKIEIYVQISYGLRLSYQALDSLADELKKRLF